MDNTHLFCPQCGSDGLDYCEINSLFVMDIDEMDLPFDDTRHEFNCPECGWYVSDDTVEKLIDGWRDDIQKKY